MLRVRELPYDDIRGILASEELRSLNAAISQRLGKAIARESNPTVTLQSVMSEVCYTGLSAQEFRNLMSQDQHLIVELVSVLSRNEESPLDGEFPPGEETGEPSQVVEELGLSRTIGVRNATVLHFLRERADAELLSYLEMSRTPHRAKVAKELRKAYQAALVSLER